MRDRSSLPANAFAILAVLLHVGATQAAEIEWAGTVNRFWQLSTNWKPFGGPIFWVQRVPTDVDHATLSSPVNTSVQLAGDTEPINGLAISNGVDLKTNGFTLTVDDGGTAETRVSRVGSLLQIDWAAGDRNQLATNVLTVESGGIVEVRGRATVDGLTTIRDQGRLSVVGSLIPLDGGELYLGGDLLIDNSQFQMAQGSQLELARSSTVTVSNGGTFAVTPIAIHDSQSIQVDSGAEMIVGFSEQLTQQEFSIGVGSTGTISIQSPGSLEVLGNTHTLIGQSGGSGTLTLSGPDASASLPGGAQLGILPHTGTTSVLRVEDDAHLTTGGLQIAGAGPQSFASVTVDGGLIDADVTSLIQGGNWLEVGSSSSSEGEAELDVVNGGAVVAYDNVHVLATGVATIDNGGELSLLHGDLSLFGGELHVLEGGQVYLERLALWNYGGILTGSGTVSGANVFNDGFVAPGDTVGTLALADTWYTQLETGTLQIELTATDNDRLEVEWGAKLGGTLEVTMVEGFLPQVGHDYEILSAQMVDGAFAAEILPQPYDWTITYGTDSVSLSVLSPLGDCDDDGLLTIADLNCICSEAGGGLQAVLSATGAIRADLNGDGDVGFADFLLLAENFGQLSVRYTQGDLDCDGRVDFGDFLLLSANYGKSNSAATPGVPEPNSFAVFVVWLLLAAASTRRNRAPKGEDG